jgi:hypothetical protein
MTAIWRQDVILIEMAAPARRFENASGEKPSIFCG